MFELFSAAERVCVLIQECPSVMDAVINPKDAEAAIALLHNVHCGFGDNNRPKVWCEKEVDLIGCTTADLRPGNVTFALYIHTNQK